jgi:uncharacterized Zn finger protein
MTRKPQSEDRAAEYIDSPLMTERLRYKREISARIDGRYGVYRTRVQLDRPAQGTCNCPSEWWPCKHVRALAATWEANPASFFDLGRFLNDLSARPKKQLVEAVAKMVMTAPECLGALGVPGFEVDDEDDEE